MTKTIKVMAAILDGDGIYAIIRKESTEQGSAGS
jgi:hypothetical protein